jgi:cellulase/cellobiase CelA1
VANSWPGGFQLGFTVTNPGSTPTANWTVSYSWPGSQAISQIWNATQTQAGAAVTIGNLSYNAAIPAGGSTTFGLIGTGTVPSTLPGLKCTDPHVDGG